MNLFIELVLGAVGWFLVAIAIALLFGPAARDDAPKAAEAPVPTRD